VIIVNEIRFRIVTKTELRGKEGTAIRLSDLRVGMLVEARGTTEATGKLIADRVKVEDDNFAGQEIQFTGVVNALFARPPLPDSIRVNGDLFEVGPQTELRGFFDEPIALAALRPGETVELKALTRMSRIPLALRLIRKAVGNGDVQVKGPIERLLDSSLVVSRLEFFISPATLILDDENFFISFSELRAGMVVAVSANRQANGRLLTTHIKLEDEANDEVELTAFIEALSDTSLVVSRTLFRVTGATVVLDKNRVPITFSALRLGMLVEVRGDRRFDGSVRATEIRIEDFLNDEIELRGAIAGLGGDSLRVTRLTFFVDVATVILDLNGNTISLAQLAVGAIVQIRADRTNNRWRASRIKVENEIDTEIAVAGRIDSLGSGGIFHALGRPLRVIEHTILLDANNDTIRFVDLRAGMIVEAQGRRLSDGSLIARRVKVESLPVDEVAVSGPITIHGAQSIAVTSIAFAVNTATVIVDVENRPLLFTNLRDGQIVEARGIRVPGGGFLATRLQLQEHRLLTGIVDQIATNSVSIAGLAHLISSRSILVDEQNQPVGASEIKSKQQVRLVAGFTNGRWEILYLRILFRGGPVAVKDPPSPSLPRNFVLYQNFPNPFWSGTSSRLARKAFTVIRFELSQPAKISLIIYNSLGQKIRTLTAGRLPAGLHERVWDGRDDAARKVAAGVYFYRLQVGQQLETRRMMMW
ncbi:MAG: DUF5666 domain-containing protein, partial [candidate division KSB1 bacterium]|nr:DUF5666 domain-containing protein [candidate division KSB1 bacterium]